MRIPAVTEVVHATGSTLRVRFDDGVCGDVDVAALVTFDGVFASLRNASVFAAVRVDAESGTVTWPNGADLDPLVLYARVRGLDPAALLAQADALSGSP